MGLLDILKAAMGLGSSRSRTTSGTTDTPRQDVDVTVEHEPDTESEDAVKGTGGAETASTDTATTDTESTETEESAAGTETDETPDVAGADEPVDTINGIGSTYADRLGEAGVDTVGDLVASDAAELAAETDISEKRIQGWIDKAGD